MASATTKATYATTKATYVLVHDIGSGAWAWKNVKKTLESKGYEVIAVDLKASGDDKTLIADVKDLNDYAKPLLKALALTQSPTVTLVAHGYGGISATLAMKKYPEKVSSIVYLNAFMPADNDIGDTNPSLNRFFESKNPCDWEDTDVIPKHAGNVFKFGEDFIENIICPDANPKEQQRAVTKTKPGIFFREINPEDKFYSGQVPGRAIISEKDLFLGKMFQEAEAKRIGIPYTFMTGDHSPMLSRVEELCGLIIGNNEA